MGAAGHRPASRPLFYGWVVVGGAFAILFMAYGAQYSFGVFLSAMLDELGWSRTGLSGAFSLYAFVYTSSRSRGAAHRPLGAARGDRGGRRLPRRRAGSRWAACVSPGIPTCSTGSWPPSACRPPSCRAAPRWRAGSCGDAGSPSASPSAAWGWARSCSPGRARPHHAGRDGAGPTSSSGWPILIVLNLVAIVMRRDPESAGLGPDGDAAPARRIPTAGAGPRLDAGQRPRARERSG